MLRRNPLAEQAAEHLLQEIRSGRWPVGSRLPSEAVLSEQLGVGRSTVREAVKALAGRQLVESRQGAGVFVVSTEPAADWQGSVRSAEVREVVEVREAIEVQAARLAATRRDRRDLTQLRRALAERRRAAEQEDDEAYVDADIAFHRSVVVAAHNELLLQLFDSCEARVRAAMLAHLAHGQQHRTAEDRAAHAAVVDAVRRRHEGDAVARASGHLRRLRDAAGEGVGTS
ncbi:DNA-binding FadR family transcriptional regulator [Motilibacter peucedani]|uniref:DNA-binding FadR family transcriptional regulator n=1 Tax=Motilibacter peucedani TaxID=598650 RepID=A0A420XVS1_9ACTN|nr:FCD domain-containing protein [Motilibacter peucedani]RKS84310.1 DNA-binding FadR family transcriptional regulator [Motilibacter peucedani]